MGLGKPRRSRSARHPTRYVSATLHALSSSPPPRPPPPTFTKLEPVLGTRQFRRILIIVTRRTLFPRLMSPGGIGLAAALSSSTPGVHTKR